MSVGLGARRTGVAVILAAAILAGPAAGRSDARPAAFDAPAGPLSRALAAFGRQSGLHVTYAPGLTAAKRSPGYVGVAERGDALSRLLAGAGLTWRFVDETTVELLDAAPAEKPRKAAKPG